MRTTFPAKLKKLVASAPKEQGDDPTMVLTLEIPVSAPKIGQVARYLTQMVHVALESAQAHLDDLSGQSGQVDRYDTASLTFSRGGEPVTLDETTGEIIDSVFGGGR